MIRRCRVVIFGGDGRDSRLSIPGLEIRTAASTREAGNGSMRAFQAALRHGAVDRVVILARWLGHSQSRAVRRACQRRGIPCHVEAAGISSVRGYLERLSTELAA